MAKDLIHIYIKEYIHDELSRITTYLFSNRSPLSNMHVNCLVDKLGILYFAERLDSTPVMRYLVSANSPACMHSSKGCKKI